MSSVLASQTARLAWLLFPRAAVHKLLVFAAYLDDAGTHDDTGAAPGSQVVAAAGYVGTPAQWESLESDWNDVLERESLPFYHVVDCSHGRGHFEGWDTRDRNRLHRTFVEIITASVLVPVGRAINTAPFHAHYGQHLAAKGPRYGSVPRPAYYECLSNAFVTLGVYMLTVAPNDQVSIVIEQAHGTNVPTLGLYESAMQLPELQSIRERFAGPPTFRPKAGYPQLQAADVLAYEIALFYRRRLAQQDYPTVRGSWDALVTHAERHERRLGFGYGLIRLAKYSVQELSP